MLSSVRNPIPSFQKPRIIGTGFIAVDVILNGSPSPRLSLGGSCGNVLSILSFLDWDCFPIAHLSSSWTSAFMYKLLQEANLHTNFVLVDDRGRAPVVVEKLIHDGKRAQTHEFHFRCPICGQPYPKRKRITMDLIDLACPAIDFAPEVVYFDRLSSSTVKLATDLREKGSLIFFEPLRVADSALFRKAVGVSHIVKYSSAQLNEVPADMYSDEFYLEIKTRGSHGVSFRSSKTKGKWLHVKGVPLRFVRDTAGAGDWLSASIIHHLGFNSTSIFEFIDDEDISKVISISQYFSAFNCLYEGARGAMDVYSPDALYDRIDRLMNNTDLHLESQSKPPEKNIEKLRNLCDYCRQEEESSLFLR